MTLVFIFLLIIVLVSCSSSYHWLERKYLISYDKVRERCFFKNWVKTKFSFLVGTLWNRTQLLYIMGFRRIVFFFFFLSSGSFVYDSIHFSTYLFALKSIRMWTFGTVWLFFSKTLQFTKGFHSSQKGFLNGFWFKKFFQSSKCHPLVFFGIVRLNFFKHKNSSVNTLLLFSLAGLQAYAVPDLFEQTDKIWIKSEMINSFFFIINYRLLNIIQKTCLQRY